MDLAKAAAQIRPLRGWTWLVLCSCVFALVVHLRRCSCDLPRSMLEVVMCVLVTLAILQSSGSCQERCGPPPAARACQRLSGRINFVSCPFSCGKYQSPAASMSAEELIAICNSLVHGQVVARLPRTQASPTTWAHVQCSRTQIFRMRSLGRSQPR